MNLYKHPKYGTCFVHMPRSAKNPISKISDHQQSWGYEDGPLKGPGPALLVAADF